VKVISNEFIIGCDVDGTLISLKKYKKGTPGTIAIRNPYVDETRYVKVHNIHLDLLREMLGRDRFVIVWSGSGVQWAKAVLKALKIKHKNILCMTKPVTYVDDLDSHHWIGSRIFLNCEGLEND
jgi:hypothetical protein